MEDLNSLSRKLFIASGIYTASSAGLSVHSALSGNIGLCVASAFSAAAGLYAARMSHGLANATRPTSAERSAKEAAEPVGTDL